MIKQTSSTTTVDFKGGFFAGVALAVCITGLVQDWMGLEGYIEYVRSEWIVLPWWIWVVPLLVCLFAGMEKVTKER